MKNLDDNPPSITPPMTADKLIQNTICRTKTKGKRGGVAMPLSFAPLSDLFARTTHYLQSDDTHNETSTFVSIDLFEEVLDRIQQEFDFENDAGWWCINQTSGAWFGTGLELFREQLWIPHSEQPHLSSLHHNGTALWIAPINQSYSGIEAIVVAGDPASNPGNGKTLGESVRRPTVTLLLSSESPLGLSSASKNIPMPFFTRSGDPKSGLEGSAKWEKWAPDTVIFDLHNTQIEGTRSGQLLSINNGPQGPELRITNPYYTDFAQLISDLDKDISDEVSVQNLVRCLAAHERIGSHLSMNHGNNDLQDLEIGDSFVIERIEVTGLSGCGMTFSPTNADIRVNKM